MGLEGCHIILPFVAEDGAEIGKAAPIAHQFVPDEMAGLVAEMAKQRAVGFVHRAARLFARRIVGLCGADGDQAFLVTGHSRHDKAVALD